MREVREDSMRAWADTHPLLAILIALAILGVIILAAALRWLREPDLAQFNQEIDDYAYATEMCAVPEADLVGTGSDDSSDTDGLAPVAGAWVREDPDGAQDVPGPVGSGAAVADFAAGLTPRQRRRAVHKGRIPRDFPGAAQPVPAVQNRTGELHERIPSDDTADRLAWTSDDFERAWHRAKYPHLYADDWFDQWEHDFRLWAVEQEALRVADLAEMAYEALDVAAEMA